MDNEIEDIFNKIANGNDDAFRAFYDNYYTQIYKYTSYFVNNKAEREEIVSDVFFNIWMNRKKNVEIKNLNGYLYILTRNTAFSYLTDKNDSTLDINDSFSSQLFDIETPENVLIDKELSEIIKNTIDRLPYRCRSIFLMSREEGLKYREIAELLSISEKTVNAQMVIAIRKISEALKKIIFFLVLII